MRLALLAAAVLHAGAVALLLTFGALREVAEAPEPGTGVAVVFDAGSAAEAEDDPAPAAWQEAAAPYRDDPGEDAAREDRRSLADEAADAAPQADAAADPTEAAPPLPPPPPEPPTAPAATARPRPSADPVRNAAPRSASQRERSGGQGGENRVALSAASAPLVAADRPATVGHRVDPVVPIEARRARLQGTVVLAVTVSPEGVPSAVDVLRSSGHLLLDRAAREALWHWRFDPARRGSVPVEERIAIPVTFRIVD